MLSNELGDAKIMITKLQPFLLRSIRFGGNFKPQLSSVCCVWCSCRERVEKSQGVFWGVWGRDTSLTPHLTALELM